MNEKHVFERGGRIYDQMCGICNAVADAPVHQMGDIQRAAAKESEPEAYPSDLIAFKWAETLSTGEQSVLLGGSLRRLQDTINSALTTVREEARAAAFKEVVAVVMQRGEIIHRGNLIAAIKAAANTEEGGGDG